MIFVAESAKEKIQEVRKSGNIPDNFFIRVSVTSGGCSGLSYKLDFDNESKPNDQVLEDNGVKVVTDLKSFLYLFNTTLEFSVGSNGKGFLFNNPNATRTCGCGESFSVLRNSKYRSIMLNPEIEVIASVSGFFIWGLRCLLRLFCFQAVSFIREYGDGAEGFGFFGRHIGVRDDDDDIAYLNAAGGGAIEADNPATAFAADGVGFEAFAIVVVHNLNFFSFQNVSGFE